MCWRLPLLPRALSSIPSIIKIRVLFCACSRGSTQMAMSCLILNRRSAHARIARQQGRPWAHPGAANGQRSGIPGLEAIPFLGEAFTPSNVRGVTRTELIIFIRPQVIRDSVDASTVAEELRAKIRSDKIGTLKPPGNVTPYPLGLVQ
jgi:Bacterial type II and III secretion system protein